MHEKTASEPSSLFFGFGAQKPAAEPPPPTIRVAYVTAAEVQPQKADPAVIFYDDFEQTADPRLRYFEYNAQKGSFVRRPGDG